MKLVVGTRNAHKIAELTEILTPALGALDLVPAQGEAPEEDATTFYENALIKARAAFADSGHPTIADDSGIEVRALGGQPGVRSARYAASGLDEDNSALLLKNLEGVEDRQAEFVCAAAYVTARGEYVIERRWEGTIAHAPSGGGGFGYDPIFLPEGSAVSAAEMSPAEKNSVSHRGQAFLALAELIATLPTE